MDSKTYWKLREEKFHQIGDKNISEIEKDMIQIYAELTKEVNKEIQSFFAKYAKEGVLTYEEINKRLNPKELKDCKTEISKYYNTVLNYGKNNPSVEFLKKYKGELKILSAKAYISRLEDLKKNLKHMVVKLGMKENPLLKNVLIKSYNEIYEKSLYSINLFRGFMNLPSPRQIDAIIQERWLGSNYSDRIWNNKQKLIDSINQKMLQGIARGVGVNRLSEDMQNITGNSYYNCRRLVRTETIHIMNKATYDSYKDSGIKKYQYLASLSEKTCEICGSLDGKVFDLKNKQEAVNYPVMHPNCRCTTIPYFEKDEIDDEFEESERSAKDEYAYTYKVPASMTFSEWKQQRRNL